jgi:single-strand DNA-binding protein
MTTRIPVTIEGNLTGDPEHGASDSGNEYARFTIAVNDRRLNETTNRWEDVGTVFHRVVVFNQQSRNVANSLRKGDSVIVAGDLFGTYTDKETGNTRETRHRRRQHRSVAQVRDGLGGPHPKANGPAADRSATGPVAQPVSTTGVGVAR